MANKCNYGAVNELVQNRILDLLPNFPGTKNKENDKDVLILGRDRNPFSGKNKDCAVWEMRFNVTTRPSVNSLYK